MPISILMPALSPTMTEGNLVKWLKKEGDTVKSGDVIAEIETDKATMEVEAADDGVLGKILIPEGTDNVKVNDVIGVLLEDGESADDIVSIPSTPTVEQPQSISAPEVKPMNVIAAPPSTDHRIKISPLAKKIAAIHHVPVQQIIGSGPYGRIIKKDIDDHLASKKIEHPSPSLKNSFLDIPMSSMRKVIAKRLSESKSSIPHFYLSTTVVLDRLLKLREHLNSNTYIMTKLSINDFVIKACAFSLKQVPSLNATYHDQYIRQYEDVDISVAVSVPGGLITPIIQQANKHSLSAISLAMKDLAKRAKEGALKPEEYQGGHFSISNLGMFGIEQFQAIINPPQVAILAVGAGYPRHHSSGTETVMNLTLSIDHRALDGTDGAQFLKVLKDVLEHPEIMMI